VVPYTDIDYYVFTSASRHLVSSCPLESVIAVSPQEEYSDLADPPEARGSCAQGIIPAVSRFVLQTEPELREMESTSTPIRFNDAKSNFEEWQSWMTSKSFAILRPAFRFLAGLGNPYKRETYRYTPLLAVLLAPGELLDEQWGPALFGKIIFILADLIVALLIWDIMDIRRKTSTKDFSWLAGVLWLVNPFTAQISTRGSSESLLGVLVLGFLDATLRSYPEGTMVAEAENGDAKTEVELEEIWNNAALLAPFLLAFSIHWKLYPIIYAAALVPHLVQSESFRGVIRYGGITIYSLIGISAPVYAIWGPPFLQETFFYHLSRSDHRHNFSPFFLPSYLSSSALSSSVLEGWPSTFLLFNSIQSYVAFIPQLAVTAYLGFSMGSQDLVAAITFQTMAFVTFNKVCTSQYYMWIIWFLPIIGPSLHFSGGNKQVIKLVVIWILAQAAWLSQAFLLEFKAKDTYVRVWTASLILLFTHVWLLIKLVQAWANGRQEALTAAHQKVRSASDVVDGKSQ